METIQELYKQGKSQKEIVEITGLAKGTISYHLGKGVKRFYYRKSIVRFRKM